MIVYKFGGATTRSVRGLENLVSIVRAAHEAELRKLRRAITNPKHLPGLVVVVSAIGHTSRRLRAIAEYAEDGKALFAGETLERVVERHLGLGQSLDLSARIQSRLMKEINFISRDVAKLVEGVTITRELSDRTLDSFLAAGERFASALIGALLEDRGVNVTPSDARKFIITNGDFTNAAPNLEEITRRANAELRPHLERGSVILTQGFIGATAQGDTTTMGIESSDLTATLLGEALGAREIVIWKTVPGIFTADPEIVPMAKAIRHISFEEADEMGRRGVRALYPKVAKPLLEKNSPAIIRVTAPSRKPHRGTTVSSTTGVVRSPKPIALALEENITTLYVKRPKEEYLSGAPHMDGSLLLATETIPSFALKRAYYYWASDTEITISVRRSEKRALVRSLKEAGYEVQEEKPLAALSLLVRYREASQDLSAIRERVLRALRRYPVRAVFPVESSFVILIDEARSEEALRKLHREFFE
jgi:aspartate kinase